MHASRQQTPTASPFFILIYLSQARLILLRAGFDVDTSPPRGEAVLHQEVDDPNEPYSDIDEELVAMAVPEPTEPSPEPSKPPGFYGHWLA